MFTRGIVVHENKIDVYETMRFDNLIETIELPETITNIKFQYFEGFTSVTDSIKFGYPQESDDGLLIAVEYGSNASHRLRVYRVDATRFINYNYMTSRFFDKKSTDEKWQELQKINVDSKNKSKLPKEYNNHQANPFKYIQLLDDFDSSGMQLLTTIRNRSVYLNSLDGKVLYKHEIGKKTSVSRIFSKPMIWTYYFYKYDFEYANIAGFDGRFLYMLRRLEENKEMTKTDTGFDGVLSESSITPNTNDGFIDNYQILVWNGKRIIAVGTDAKALWSEEMPLKPPGIDYCFYPRTDGLTQYFERGYYQVDQIVSSSLDSKIIGSYTTSYFLSDSKRNVIIRPRGVLYNTFFILEQKDSKPIIVCRYVSFRDSVLYAFGTRNIDEEIENVYLTCEDGRPVFYFLSKMSIFRWENSAEGFINLKPSRFDTKPEPIKSITN